MKPAIIRPDLELKSEIKVYLTQCYLYPPVR